jgi:hypothetical protein
VPFWAAYLAVVSTGAFLHFRPWLQMENGRAVPPLLLGKRTNPDSSAKSCCSSKRELEIDENPSTRSHANFETPLAANTPLSQSFFAPSSLIAIGTVDFHF